MADCNTPEKRQFRSRAAANRWQRKTRIPHKARLQPYRCRSGEHWHLTHNQPGWNDIPIAVDQDLRSRAVEAVEVYSDTLLTGQGWTRIELIDAVHKRLRTKYRALRDSGQLERDEQGQIRISRGEIRNTEPQS